MEKKQRFELRKSELVEMSRDNDPSPSSALPTLLGLKGVPSPAPGLFIG